ncbi:hypothetical protein SAMN02800691_2992 [Luteibacter sp. UNCMF366Tsu5.1]|nr:hypothetical protein SAMN02800691_2992 [Luteibacter sp. UNCMF366Tsu5.1]
MNKRWYGLCCLIGIAWQSALAAAPDCGEKRFAQQISDTAAKVLKAAPVEPTVGEFPTAEGTPECIRVEFRLSPDGSPWNIRTPESSGSFAFNLSAMRAFEKYRFRGSWWSFWKVHVLVLRGKDNKQPPGWDSQ